jgi:hypothetical protein
VQPVVTSSCRYLNSFLLRRASNIGVNYNKLLFVNGGCLEFFCVPSAAIELCTVQRKISLDFTIFKHFFKYLVHPSEECDTSFRLCNLSYYGRIADRLFECEMLTDSVGTIP